MNLSLICLESGGLQLYEKRDSDTGIFLWILRKFLNTSFKEHGNFPGEYFCRYYLKHQLFSFSFFCLSSDVYLSHWVMFLSYLSSDYDYNNTFWLLHSLQLSLLLKKTLVFILESMSWCKRSKKRENSKECLTLGLLKTLILKFYLSLFEVLFETWSFLFEFFTLQLWKLIRTMHTWNLFMKSLSSRWCIFCITF